MLINGIKTTHSLQFHVYVCKFCIDIHLKKQQQHHSVPQTLHRVEIGKKIAKARLVNCKLTEWFQRHTVDY